MATPNDGVSPSSKNKENIKSEDAEYLGPPPTLPVSLQGVAKQGKSKRNSKALANRGPTALPKNRGTGFEGTI
jgi:hypothetical protein